MFGLYLDFVLTELDDFKSKDNFEQNLECSSAQLNLFYYFFGLLGSLCGGSVAMSIWWVGGWKEKSTIMLYSSEIDDWS